MTIEVAHKGIISKAQKRAEKRKIEASFLEEFGMLAGNRKKRAKERQIATNAKSLLFVKISLLVIIHGYNVKRIFVKALLLFLSSVAFAGINEHRDFQLWIFDSISKEISDKNTLFIESEVRFADDASNFHIGYIQALLRHEIRPWLFIVPGYRQLWVRGSNTAPVRTTYNPFIDGVIKLSFEHFVLFDRNRLQYVIFEQLENRVVYRNRIYLTTIKTFGRAIARPFISDEVFFVEGLGFEQNRISVGLALAAESDASPKLFYMLRHRKDLLRSWEYQNILGLMLFVNF